VYDLVARLGVSSELGEHQMKIVIVETGGQTVGVIVEAVDQGLTVEDKQLEETHGADTRLIDWIAKLGEWLVVLRKPATIFTGLDAAAA